MNPQHSKRALRNEAFSKPVKNNIKSQSVYAYRTCTAMEIVMEE
jgi:hypothetical protein